MRFMFQKNKKNRSKKTIDVLIITNIRSSHQVELFDAVARGGNLSIFVLYLLEITKDRKWKTLPSPSHPFMQLPVWFKNCLLFYNPGLIRQILKIKPKTILITQYVGLSNVSAMILSTILRIPWFFWSESPGVKFFEVRSKFPDWLRKIWRKKILTFIGKFSTQIWGIGLRATYQFSSFSKDRAVCLTYAFDTKKYRRINVYTPNNHVRILFSGKCNYRKGFDLLLDVIQELAKRIFTTNWTFTICGDGDLLSKVQNLSESVKKHINIIGFKELSEMPSIYCNHDIFLLPSRYDGWGMSVVEALAAGLVVLSTFETGSAFHIGNRPALSLFHAEDTKKMVDALSYLILNPNEIPWRGADALEAARCFDAEIVADRFVSLVNKVLRKC